MLPFTPANRNNLIGWIAGRSDDPTLRQGARLQLSEDEAGRRTAANRGAHRSERAALGSVLALEPAGLERPPRRTDRHSGRDERCSTPSRSSCRPSTARCRSCGSSCWRCRIASRTRPRSRWRWRPCSGKAPSTLALDGAAARGGVAASSRPVRPRPAGAPRLAASLGRQHAHLRSRARLVGVSATDGRGPAGRSGPAARGTEAEARTAPASATVTVAGRGPAEAGHYVTARERGRKTITPCVT